MSNKLSKPQSFWDLRDEDKDLTMFTITNLTLIEKQERNMVNMAIKLKRKVVTSSVTTFLFNFMAMDTMFSSSSKVKFVMVNMVKSLSLLFRSKKIFGLPNLSDIKI